MAYTKQEWRNGVEGNTPTSARRFTHMETGIASVDEANRQTQAQIDKLERDKADAARKITAGAGLKGGGSLADDRVLAVEFGQSANTACEGNDGRLTNQRVPTNSSVTRDKLAAAVRDDIDRATKSDDYRTTKVLSSADYDALGTNVDPHTMYYVFE